MPFAAKRKPAASRATSNTSKSAAIAVGVVLLYASVLSTIYYNFPKMDAEERAHFKYPRSLDDAKRLGSVLSRYKDQHFYTVLAGVASVYIVLQSFAIPGSIFLTILSGYLFPFWMALLLVCSCSAFGAAMCFYLASTLGRNLIMKLCASRLQRAQQLFVDHRENLLNYMIFLRITPILPNWFINIASPVLDVPIKPFFWGTLLGVAPPSFLFIKAGTTLQDMTHTNAALSWSSIAALVAFGALSLLPVFYKQFKSKTE